MTGNPPQWRRGMEQVRLSINFLLVRKFKKKTTKFGVENPIFWGNLEAKLYFRHLQSPLSEICSCLSELSEIFSCLSKNCYYYPPPAFVTQDAADSPRGYGYKHDIYYECILYNVRLKYIGYGKLQLEVIIVVKRLKLSVASESDRRNIKNTLDETCIKCITVQALQSTDEYRRGHIASLPS